MTDLLHDAPVDGPALHFTREEFADRLTRVRAQLEVRGLDGLLVFAQESLYWLTGHDTFGYCFFQCLALRADGTMTLLVRSADYLQAKQTSLVDDIRVWKDGAGVDPTADLAEILTDLELLEPGQGGKRIGVEMDTHGLTAANHDRLRRRFSKSALLLDASDLISSLRLIKSPAEIAYVRKAAEVGDAMLEAARPFIAPGGDEGLILAALQGDCFAQGGDYPANETIIGSGPMGPYSGALLCRYRTGRRLLSAQDQLTLEWAGVWRHYHAALMRTIVIGAASDAHREMHDAARSALLACEAALVPGNTMGEVFDAHVVALEAAGFGHARLNACGYSLGARFTPSWMEHQMFYEGAPTVVAPNMVFFLHMILMDADSGAAMTLGRTSLVTETGAEPLSKLPLVLDVV